MDLSLAYEQLDAYALSVDGESNFFSDLLMFRNITKRELRAYRSLHKIPTLSNFQAFLFQKYLVQYSEQKDLTLVFVGSGTAVLEIYVALHALENYYAFYGHRFRKFRVILSDLQEPDEKHKNSIEFIFSIAQGAFPEVELSWNKDILTIFPLFRETDNYRNTVFLAFNLSMPIFIDRVTNMPVNSKAKFVAILKQKPYWQRFENTLFISCSSINPNRNDRQLGIWIDSYSLKQFADEKGNTPTRLEACLGCGIPDMGQLLQEQNAPERLFCNRKCQVRLYKK